MKIRSLVAALALTLSFSAVAADNITTSATGSVTTSATTATKKVIPTYPRDALASQVEGYVQVELTLDQNGSVKSAVVKDAKPAKTFDATTLKALKRWEFNQSGGTRKVRVDYSM